LVNKESVNIDQLTVRTRIREKGFYFNEFSSVLEVEPNLPQDPDLRNEASLLKMSGDVSTLQGKIKFLDIPSDFGFVGLSTYGTLRAIKEIPENTPFTVIPTTFCSNVIPSNGIKVLMGDGLRCFVKKLYPFMGFGSFAHICSDRWANCEMEQVGSFLFLKSTKKNSSGSSN